jgi:hypothetical protein
MRLLLIFALLLAGTAAAAAQASADQPAGSGAHPAHGANPSSARKPAPQDAKVYFIYPKDGDFIPPKTVMRFGLVNMGVAPAGIDRPDTGHHHLLIDTKLPPFDQPIPNDFNHLHFGAGQTEAEVTLPLGRHTLQLLLGDDNHVPHDPPVYSAPITVIVTATGEAPPKPKPKARRVHHPRAIEEPVYVAPRPSYRRPFQPF